jgi:hypothetical protein
MVLRESAVLSFEVLEQLAFVLCLKVFYPIKTPTEHSPRQKWLGFFMAIADLRL